MTEHEFSPHPERSPEQAVELGDLPEALGYRETAELSQLRSELIEAMRVGADTKALATRYQDQAEEVASKDESERARLGVNIAQALIRREGGKDYADDLEAAAMHAHQMGVDDVAAVLFEELERIDDPPQN